MKIKNVCKLALAASVLAAGSAHAALFNFTGNIQNHNDVVFINFTLNADATNVRVWTDSFMSATNFDPITALWRADGSLIAQDDDNASINPATQTWFDSGFSLASLTAGDYIFSVATFNNFASGSNLSDGFSFDGQTPIALADWTQPANHTGMGSYWSVWLDGVDSADGPDTEVPVTAPLALLGFAFAGLFAARRRG